MHHKEVIQLIEDFFDGKRCFILPSTSSDEYETFLDWEIGVRRNYEMAEIISLLEENTHLTNVDTYKISNSQDLSPEQKSAIVLSWLEKYKIERIVIKGSDKIFYRIDK